MPVPSSPALRLATVAGVAMPGDRIAGWKSIGAYFGRDRTTAIRWARERALPVHRMPGGKTGTVFALRHELDAWAAGDRRTQDINEAAAPATSAAAPPAGKRRLTGWASAGAILLAAVAVGSPVQSGRGPAAAGPVMETLPRDRVIAERYLAARDLVASRDAQSLERAILLLRDVTRRAPDHAPGYAALAEALILSREFGIRSDGAAFPDARFAAQTALRLDPDLASGHRMLGFIHYWWDHDVAAARAAFERAIALAPGDAITRFWYGNILTDHGDFAAGLRTLNAARAMQPGSAAILTDLAWAEWSAGERARPLATLAQITRDHPRLAVAYDCLAVIHFAEGDYAGYAAALARLAALRQDRALIAQVAEVQAALARGARAAHEVVLRHALRAVADNPRQTYVWPILVASMAGDRGQVRALLGQAAQRKETWGDAGIVRRIALRWQGDAEISRLLRDRKYG